MGTYPRNARRFFVLERFCGVGRRGLLTRMHFNASVHSEQENSLSLFRFHATVAQRVRGYFNPVVLHMGGRQARGILMTLHYVTGRVQRGTGPNSG